MIVRILTEGQYRLPSALFDQLNELDNQIVEAVAREDQEAFQRLFPQMIDLVRKNGQPVPVEELVESDVVVPAPDSTLEEVKGLFAGEGLIPG